MEVITERTKDFSAENAVPKTEEVKMLREASPSDYRAVIGEDPDYQIKGYYTSLQAAVDDYTEEDCRNGFWIYLLSDNSEIITVNRRIILSFSSNGHAMDPENIKAGDGFRLAIRESYGDYTIAVSDITVSAKAEGTGGNVSGDTKHYFSGSIFIDSSGSAILKAEGQDETYLAPCTFTAAPAENFTFEKWSYSINGVDKGDLPADTIQEENIDGSIVFTAHFKGLPVTVNFEAGGGTPVPGTAP